MKKFSIILISTVLLVSIFSFAVFAGGIKVGFVANNMQADSNVLAAKGMEDYCARMGWEFKLTDCQNKLLMINHELN